QRQGRGRHHAGRSRHGREAASAAGRLDRRGSLAMRLLHQWLDHDGGFLAEEEPEALGRRDPRGPVGPEMPLRHASRHPARRQARIAGRVREGRDMTHFAKTTDGFSRRAFLAASGALVVTIAAPPGWHDSAFAQSAAGTKSLAPDQLDSWIAIDKQGRVTAFFGKIDGGQGVDAAVAQIVAEELDVPFARVAVVLGDTRLTVNQGGASGSTGLQKGGLTMRYTAAEARRVLVEMASQKLGVPADQLSVTDGIVSAKADAAKTVSYADLIGGRSFDTSLEWNK